MDTNVLTGRLMRVLRFDASVYREIAADQSAMPQAGIVVTVAALLAAIGQWITTSVVAMIVFAIVAIVAFFIYTAVATVVSKALFKGQTDFNEMGRTLGYAYAWYGLGILALLPFGGGFLTFLGQIVAGVAGIIALRESAEFDTVKAIVTVVIAAIVAAIITGLLAAPLIGLLGVASSG